MNQPNQRSFHLRKVHKIQLNATSVSHYPVPSYLTFDELIFNSLMPWLPENILGHRFEALLSRIKPGESHYFPALAGAYRKTGIPVSDELYNEWISLQGIEESGNVRYMAAILDKGVPMNPRQSWYQLTIRHALAMHLHQLHEMLKITSSQYHIKAELIRAVRKTEQWESALELMIMQYSSEAPVICRIWIAIRIIGVYLNIQIFNAYVDINIPVFLLGKRFSGMEMFQNDPSLEGIFKAFDHFIVKNQDQMNGQRAGRAVAEKADLDAGSADIHSTKENERASGNATIQESEPWLSSAELCKHLGIGTSKLHSLTKQNDFPVNTITRNRKYRLSEVNDWLKHHPEKIRYCLNIQDKEEQI